MKTKKVATTKPIFVLISDVHYSVHTLKLADASMRQAIEKANILNVPLVVAGDMHDTKANMRAECVNAMIETIALARRTPYILVGNHDRINEKAPEHALNFLNDIAVVIDKPLDMPFDVHAIPYHHDPQELQAYLDTLEDGRKLIMHQGVQGSNMGDYVQDKSALPTSSFARFQTISGHYHARQTIACATGVSGDSDFRYIGNPYTTSYGEATDPVKGFQVLYDDGTMEHVPTNLRKHIVFQISTCQLTNPNVIPPMAKEQDLLWVKIHGPREDLAKLTRAQIADHLRIDISYRLDLVPNDKEVARIIAPSISQNELLDQVIDSHAISDGQKGRLKVLWKGLV